MPYTSTISAFKRILPRFNFVTPRDFCENFAQARFHKKLVKPGSLTPDQLHQQCWENWIEHDKNLPELLFPPTPWFHVKKVFKDLPHIKLSSIGFPKGSEFIPTRGNNSLEAKLCQSVWTCTDDNFDLFAKIVYRHNGLKKAFRRRYRKWLLSKRCSIARSKRLDAFLYDKCKNSDRPAFEIFKLKLERVTTFVHGSRFSSVPKDESKNRPINVEPFGNLVVQRTIGNGIRKIIKSRFNIDLDNLAAKHRYLIRDVDAIATIDLKNCSDAITHSLCRFLLPPHLFRMIDLSRSSLVLGADDQYHVIQKVSSMGNGYTFELMTLILLTLARSLDSNATVFGDDIIIKTDSSEQLISCLEAVGFTVNDEKSFTSGPFRESCGANYHRDFGYIESYDFLLPESIGDCVVTFNKVARLRLIYPSFEPLFQVLLRSVPRALHGGPDNKFLHHTDVLDLLPATHDEAPAFPSFFVTPRSYSERRIPRKVAARLTELNYDPAHFKLVPGYEFKPALRSPTVSHLHAHRHWAKILMYLSSGRTCKDVISGRGQWTRIWFVNSGSQHFRVRSLST